MKVKVYRYLLPLGDISKVDPKNLDCWSVLGTLLCLVLIGHCRARTALAERFISLDEQ